MTWKNGPWAEIAQNCWIAPADPGNANIGLVAGTHEALLIDTGTYPEQARDLCRTATELAGVSVRHVVITHQHAEHWFGLAGIASLTSYGQESLAAQSRTSATQDEAERLGISDLDIIVPQRLFAQAEVVDLGDRFVEMLHTGSAHTVSDVWVNIADARVLFAGDLVSVDEDPCFGTDSDIFGWAKTLDLLVQNTRPDAVIVPGHGSPTTQEAVMQQATNMHSLIGQTKMLIQGGTKREGVEEIGGWPYTASLTAALDAAWRHHMAKGVRRSFDLTPRSH